MIDKNLSAATLFLLAALGCELSAAAPGVLRTSYTLDDERGYCIDIRGFGDGIQLDAALQVHTCKYGAGIEDQVFEEAGDANWIRAPEYDVCLAAESLDSGAELFVRPCTDSALQDWTFSWGRLSPESRPDLCVAVDGEAGEPAGTPARITPVYRHQHVSLQTCAVERQSLQTFRWSSRDERGVSDVDVARAGMPAEIADTLRGFGRTFSGDIVRQTAELYADVPRVYGRDEIEVELNVAYGADARQQFDIHTAAVRRAPQPVPTVIVFHGGGLAGGSRASTANAADFFASIGYVGVNATYRLAPDNKWPAGARDVASAVSWLKENVSDYGGDPEQVFVMGLSSGAYHSATYVFRPELLAPGTARPAGAILMSGPYTFDFDNPSAGELGYFGDDSERYAEQVVIGNVTRTDIPVFLTTAEWDIDRYTIAFAALVEELMIGHGVVPRYKQSLGHNHTSQLAAIGSADTDVSAEIVDFIERTIAQ